MVPRLLFDSSGNSATEYLEGILVKNKVEGVISIGVNVNRGGRKEGEETLSSRSREKTFLPRSTTRKLRFDAVVRGNEGGG